MKLSSLGIGAVLVLLWSGCSSTTDEQGSAGYQLGGRRPLYPYSPTNDIVDHYHGVAVPDPYRWLENEDSAATEAWVAAQNRLTSRLLNQIPEHSWIRARLSRLWSAEWQGLPVRRGERLFYLRNDGTQPRSTLWCLDESDPVAHLLLDPARPPLGAPAVLTQFEPSPDGSQVAYGLTQAGEAGDTWRVRDVASGTDLTDEVRQVNSATVAWKRDGQGFFYSRIGEQEAADETVVAKAVAPLVSYHRLGTPQSEDTVILHWPEHKDWNLHVQVTNDGQYLLITAAVGTGTTHGVWVMDLTRSAGEVRKLLGEFDASYRYVANDGSRFFFFTNNGAPLGRLIALDEQRPGTGVWEEIVPPAEDVLEAVTQVGDLFVLRYLRQAVSHVVTVDRRGQRVAEIPLPGLGSVSGFRGTAEDRETFFAFTSFTTPPTVYRCDLNQPAIEPWHAPATAFDPTAFETRQVVYRSRDGTPVPMFLSYRKGVPMDASRPTLLQVYGGFGLSMKPRFSVAQMAWMELGGVYAVPNLRGGGEFGEVWHQAGVGLLKPKVLEDCVGAAEWLIANDVTNPRRLAVMGNSNGGMVVGACMTQRPGLFAVALPSAGVFDLLRFSQFTIGWSWIPEYGDVSNRAAFHTLRSYSPLHNIREGAIYPSTLVTATAHDPNIVPGHSYKFIAALQATHAGDNPVLIRIRLPTAEGGILSVDQLLDETAAQLAFAIKELGITLPVEAPSPPSLSRSPL